MWKPLFVKWAQMNQNKMCDFVCRKFQLSPSNIPVFVRFSKRSTGENVARKPAMSCKIWKKNLGMLLGGVSHYCPIHARTQSAQIENYFQIIVGVITWKKQNKTKQNKTKQNKAKQRNKQTEIESTKTKAELQFKLQQVFFSVFRRDFSTTWQKSPQGATVGSSSSLFR